MRNLILIILALKAISRNKTRSFLTMLGIIIGVASVITMLAIGQGSKQSIEQQVSEMGANMIMVFPGGGQRGGARLGASDMPQLTWNDAISIRNNSRYISHISPLVSGNGQAIAGANNWPTSIQGVSTDYLTIRKLDISQGSLFSEYDINSAAKVCILGKTVINNLFKNGEQPLGQIIRYNQIPFTVIGILKEKGVNTFGQDQDDVIIAPFTTVQKRILGINHIQNIYLSAINEESSQLAIEEVETALRKNPKLVSGNTNKFEIRSQHELLSMMGSTNQMMTLLLAAIAGISLLVGGIGIMNIMFVSVTERTREIGLRMAVGGKERHILTQFLMEAIIVSVGGGLIGIFSGILASLILGKIAGWPMIITQSSIILSFFVCAIIGVFFGWYPARKAASLDPIEALRYE
ncbi:ABC transporter permease [Alkaliflexus imshenetskii]|uniref:ABC transporter permease n=1 Tax=Alkaliflexus imshenetskii TaxID=286730 RepID=UPI00047D829E|nr:ABC transporter permease [Alkaliflexus imshenetskii]